MSVRRIIPVAIGVLTVVAVVGGFLTLGSPEHQRRLNSDSRAIDDISAISSRFRLNTRGALPEHLDQSDLLQTREGLPDTQISYRRIDVGTYDLCTTFLEPSSNDDYRAAFKHAAGRTCYTFSRARPGAPIKTTSR